jgi:predicted CoA-substrate-specific enzyme activase
MTSGKMIFAGIDIGSLSTDVVLLDRKGEIAGAAVVPTGASTMKACEEAFSRALAEAGAPASAIVFTVSTGYGRERVSSADLKVTEITCHARGARHLFPEARTVLDIGGQDSKVIRLSSDGKVADFAMNDKCAAGTGRFLEVMARTLELDLEEMGPCSLRSRRTVPISSMCTVFAESEVISLITSGTSPEDIARGIHLAIADRIAALADKVGMVGPAIMTGGVAKNPGARNALEAKFGFPLLVPGEPQLTGALGAALIAREKSQDHH